MSDSQATDWLGSRWSSGQSWNLGILGNHPLRPCTHGAVCTSQSTACEQQEYEKLLLELDSTLLVTLALGKW